jgi:hypothetical protein
MGAPAAGSYFFFFLSSFLAFFAIALLSLD